MDSVSNVSFLSSSQETLLAFIPIAPALISLWASYMLLRLLYLRGFKTPMRRILLGVASTDIFTAVNATLQSFLVPKETSRRLYAIGNDASCSYLGWAFTFSTTSFFYYAALAFYFLMVVKFGMKDSVFARKIEPYLHVFIILISVSVATIGLALGLYGEVQVGAGCWLRTTDTCDGDCIKKYEGFFGGLPFVFSLATVIVSNVLIFYHVRGTIYENIKKSQERWAQNLKNIRLSLNLSNRISFSKHSSGMVSSSMCSSSQHHSSHHSSDRSRKAGPSSKAARKTREWAIAKEERAAKKAAAKAEKEAKKAAKKAAQQKARENLVQQATASPEQRRKVKRVGVQSFLYCAVFLVTYSWTTVLTTYRNTAETISPEIERVLYPFIILRAFFIPLMGLWNLLIYVRPRYCTCRDQENAKENGESSFKSLRRVIWDPDAGLLGRGKSGRKRYGSTKTQCYKSNSAKSSMGSLKSKFGSAISFGSARSRPGSTLSLDGPLDGPLDRPPPSGTILERGESQVTQIGATPSVILERGESQHTQLGALSRDFSARALRSRDCSARTVLATGEVTTTPPTICPESTDTDLTNSTLTVRLDQSSSQDSLSDDRSNDN